MALKVEHYYDSAWNDISDYVVGCSPVPYITKNRDGTLRAESFTMTVAGSLCGVSPYPSDFEFSKDEEIKITDGATHIFYGQVKQATGLNLDRQEFEVEVANGLDLLKEDSFLVCETGVKTGLFWYEYLSGDNYNRELVGILWVLEQLFDYYGFTLDTTDVNTEVMFNDATAGFEKDVTYGDLLTWWAMLRTIGEDYAGSGVTSIVSSFDFVSELCSYLELLVINTGEGTYKLIVADGAGYTIADDDAYSYEFTGGAPEESNIKIKMMYGATFNDYTNASPTALDTTVEVGYGDEPLDKGFFNSLYIFWTDEIPQPYVPLIDLYNYRVMLPTYDLAHPLNNWNPALQKIKAYTQNYTKEKIRCPIQTTITDVLENYIDLETRTSEIVQEEYL